MLKQNFKRSSGLVLLLLVVLAGGFYGRTSMTASANIKKAQTPTYNKEVVRLMQKHCQSCHHPGDIAPFSMTSYSETRPWAAAIREAVISKEMPPWKPLAGCGDFKDARSLTQDEINTFTAWADGGAPEGNAADLPAPMQFTEGWPLGKPDFIASLPEPFTPPLGKDTYRCFSVPTASLRGDRWAQGLDVQPGNRKIVHHVIAYSDPKGLSVALDQKEAGPGYTCFGGPGFNINLTTDDILNGNSILLGGWAPGSRGYFAPEGLGTKLPSSPTARVVVQVHYHPTDKLESDQTSVGFYMAQKPVNQPMLPLILVNQTFAIPAGAKNYSVTAFIPPLGLTGKLVGITPHMHLLGQTIKVTATTSGGQPQCLVNIPKWDFNWQGSYLYQDPIPFGANTRLDLACTFDNSTDNPYQPNLPPKIVRWGEETTDEMALAFLAFTLDLVRVTPSSPALTDATIDANGNLLVTGSGFAGGADIEINGQRVSDTQTDNATRLMSSHFWKVTLAPGQTANVTVINPDGRRTASRSITRAGTARAAAVANAASYAATLAPDGIAAVFGDGLATATQAATITPLPTTLAGTTVRINGVAAPLFFVSRGQVNLLVPPDTQPGNAIIEIVASDGTLSRGTFAVSNTSPSFFTANASGSGTPAALVTPDGVTYRNVANADGSPIALTAGEFLVLFGTGIRRAPGEMISLKLGGRSVEVLYAGAQGSLVGLDQVNVQLPEGLSGAVDVAFTANGKPANLVRILMK